MTKDTFSNQPFIYALLSAGTGALNIISILVLTKMLASDLIRLDFLYYILSLIIFMIPIFVGPISAGLSRHIKIRHFNKHQEINFLKKISDDSISIGVIFILPIVFILVLWGGMQTSYVEHLFLYSLMYSFLAVSTIFMEILRIEAIYLNRFKLVSESMFIISFAVFVCVLLFKTMEAYLIALLIGRIILIFYFKSKIFKLKMFSLQFGNSKDLFYFYSLNKVYSASSIVTSIAGYLPSVILLEIGQGLVAVYYFIQRIVLSPISLIIVPLVDFFRFKLFKNTFSLKLFLKLLPLFLLFGLTEWLLLIFFGQKLSIYFFSNIDQIQSFQAILPLLAPLALFQTLFVFNTRVSESVNSINKMASYGVIGHMIFIIALLTGLLLSNWLLIVQVRLAIELLIFFPLGIYFVYMSNKIEKNV